MTHELKIHNCFFKDILSYKKRFEYRLNDRNFKEGDVLHLREWISINMEYTGRSLKADVLYTWPVKDAGRVDDYSIVPLNYLILGISEPYEVDETITLEWCKEKL